MKVNKVLSKTIFLAILPACMFFATSDLFAQVKIGANPTTIGTNNNLEVEAANGNKTVIQKNNGNVGIGTTTPTAKLHVQGNQILGNAALVDSSTGTSQLVRDNATGEIKILKTTTTNSFPLSSVTYVIKNVAKDWIVDFDTKIPAKDYVVIITGLVFNNKFLTTQPGAIPGIPDSTLLYSPLNFSAFPSGGTWRLSADYNGGTTADDSNGSWTVKCLIINKSIIQVLSNQVSDLGGLNTGAASTPPTGL